MGGSFRDAVAADFDGNGKTDIAFGDHAWRYSPDGRGALRTLRRDEASPNPPLHRLLVGNFNGEPRATVVWYGKHDPKNFGIWRGLGSLHSFVKLSEQKMR